MAGSARTSLFLLRAASLAGACLLGTGAMAQEPAPPGPPALPRTSADPNPYHLEPFHPDFPVALQYPTPRNVEYERTRRQLLERIVANLQGGGSYESWQTATEFFWSGPEEIVEPLIEATDAAIGDPSKQDMVRNCLEAMGRMANPVFDEVLRRALESRTEKVRQAAFCALGSSGAPATLRAVFPVWGQLDARARLAWLRGARTRLGAEAVPMFRILMMTDYPTAVRDQVLQETLHMDVKDAAVVLRGRWEEAVAEFKAIIAGVLHGAGDSIGTAWLLDVLKGSDLQMLPLAIRHSGYGPIGDLRDALFALSTHPRFEVRLELAKLLTKVDDPGVVGVYELMGQPDEVWEIKSIALRELHRRGQAAVANALLEEVRTAEGTRLATVLSMLGATADPRAVPIFVERFRSAPEGRGRPFLQSLAVIGGDAGAKAMIDLFTGEERVVDRTANQGKLTTITYLPLLMMNARGTLPLVTSAFAALPMTDWRRRAALLPALVGMTVDSEDQKANADAIAAVKSVLFDSAALPQLRVLALNQLTRRHLTVDDVLKLRTMRFDETPTMRALLNDFLVEYF